MTKFRNESPFPAAHMRLLGEISVQWTHAELIVLQAVCELNDIDELPGTYLGSVISFPKAVGLLETIADDLRDHRASGRKMAAMKDSLRELHDCLQALRSAYRLRNKYLLGTMTSQGAHTDPRLHCSPAIHKPRREGRALDLAEMQADSDRIHDATSGFLAFMQRQGFCKVQWL